jgi:hypothetical protein
MKTNFIISIRKHLLNAAFGTIFGISALFSQSQNWWRTNGNTPQSTDFLGTSNNSPLIIKTNNLERLRIAPNGFIGIANSNPQYPLDINGRTKFRFNVYCDSLMQCSALKVSNLSGSNNGLLITDAQGNLSRFNWSGNNNDVLTGNGSWTSINTLLPPQLWQNSGQNIFYTNGNVGIGTNSPLFSLDVVGDVRVSNNVYVGGGVIISDKVNAFTEVTAPKMTASEASLSKMRADSIMMDSTKAIYGQTIVRGDVKLENKLTIQGDAKFSGNLVATQGIKFNDSIGFKYISGNGNTPDYITFGKMSNIPSTPAVPNVCITMLNQMPGPIFYGGAMQLFYYNSSLYLSADGANGIIESGNTNPNMGGLLLNYLCGKDVYVGNANSGNLTANKNLYVNGKLGVGTNNPGCSVDIQSSVNDNGLCVETNHSVDYGYVIYAKANRPLTKVFGANLNNTENFVVYADGTVFGREVNVQVGPFNHPDYVFEPNYKNKMLPIKELEKYLIKEKHLPGMPSAKELKEKGYYSLGELFQKHLEKTEELYLYIIELQKQIDGLKKENEELKKKIN